MMNRLFALLALLTTFFCGAAQASNTHSTISFFATDFFNPDFVAPAATVSGSLTYSWDSGYATSPEVVSTNLTIAGQSMSALITGYSKSFIWFGSKAGGGLVAGTNGFELFLDSGGISYFGYTLAGYDTIWYAQNAFLTPSWSNIPPIQSAVPEAGTYAMLLAGLGLMGIAVRRKAAAER